MTAMPWRSAFVARSLHSIPSCGIRGWAAERKDVLSTFFWIITIQFYLRYIEKATGETMAQFSYYFPWV